MRYTEKTHLIDPDFQVTDSGHSDLLVRITSSRFSYAVVDQSKDQLKILFDASYRGGVESLDDAFLNAYLPDLEFGKVKIALETSKFTFIPAEMYSEDDLPHYANFVEGTPSELIVSDIRNPKIKNIAAFDDQVLSLLNARFSSYKLYNLANPLLEAAMKSSSGSGLSLILNFNANSFEAIALNGRNFSFYNIFQCGSYDDFNYFLLLILKQLQLNPQTVNVLVSGLIDASDEKYKRLQKYFTAIELADQFIIPVSDLFKPVPAHHFFSLTGINLCE